MSSAMPEGNPCSHVSYSDAGVETSVRFEDTLGEKNYPQFHPAAASVAMVPTS